MPHLKMHSMNKIDENVRKIAALFPNCVTEAKDDNGEIVHKIDFDMLKQELSTALVEGREERYQFTWPDKRQAILTANAPTDKTLRPCREESVDFDNTQNLYIEGDNLEVLKLLQETYLGKIKMIYIDPPYNTGNDFVYEDDFAQDAAGYIANSGQTDEDGNRLVANTESNGRFHTDWLNMMYPRLKLARDLLSDDGVIFISIDDNEVENLKKICDEILGECNFIAEFIWKSKLGKVGTTSTVSATHEYIICYSKNINNVKFKMIENRNEVRKENLRQWGVADRREDRPSMFYPIEIEGKTVLPIKEDGSEGRWRVGEETAKELLKQGVLELSEKNGKLNIFRKFPEGVSYTSYDTLLLDEIGTTAKGAIALKNLDMGKLFDFSKPIELIKHFAKISTSHGLDFANAKSENNKTGKSLDFPNPCDAPIILDFFSGSATTAHAVMKLNAEDGGNRKFIMVQLPELCDEKSEAYKAGYKNICEIGKERIRRAGKQLLQNTKQITGGGMENSLFENSITVSPEAALADSNPCDNHHLDIGFRVLKCDSSNMEDVYYTPDHFDKNDLFKSNIKLDRSPEDLLFQVMLDLGIMLSSKIEIKEIDGKTVFYVEGNYLVACFAENVDEKTITEIAKEKPYYFVMRDASMANDSVATNFEQIFKTFSPETNCKVL